MPAVDRPFSVAVATFAILAFVTASPAIVAAKLPVPDPVTSPVSVTVWSPVLVPESVAFPLSVRVRSASPVVTVSVRLAVRSDPGAKIKLWLAFVSSSRSPVFGSVRLRSPVTLSESSTTTPEPWISFPVVESKRGRVLSVALAGPVTFPVLPPDANVSPYAFAAERAAEAVPHSAVTDSVWLAVESVVVDARAARTVCAAPAIAFTNSCCAFVAASPQTVTSTIRGSAVIEGGVNATDATPAPYLARSVNAPVLLPVSVPTIFCLMQVSVPRVLPARE